MGDAAQMVACARGWLGTRFCHQGRRKRSAQDAGGVDCLGLLIGVADELGLQHDGAPVRALDELAYGHLPDEAYLRTRLETVLQPASSIGCGQVALMRVDGRAQHVGLVGDYAHGEGFSLIHAYAPARAVVEHQLDALWQQRIVQLYAWA